MAELITLPGVKGAFAAGLSWRHEDAIPKAKALRAMASEKGRWGVVRKTGQGTIQVGFCEPIDGVKSPSSVRALAALVADHKVQPWRGVYKIGDDRYWYIAVRDGQEVIPEGDSIGTLAEIQDLFELHRGFGEWDREEENGSLEDLAEMVQATAKRVALRDLQKRAWIGPALLGMGACGIVGAGLFVWHLHEDALQAQRARELAHRMAIQAALQRKRDAQAAVLPWTRQAMPSDFFRVCAQAWAQQAMDVAGWDLSGWTCQLQPQGVTIQTSWRREGGLAQDAPGMLTGSDGNDASATRELDVKFAQASAAVAVQAAMYRSLWTLSQTYGFGLEAQVVRQPPRLPGAAAGPKAPPPPPWLSVPTSFTMLAPPWSGFGRAFDAVPALRASSVQWDPQSGEWKVSATAFMLRAPIAAPTRTAAAGGALQPGGHR